MLVNLSLKMFWLLTFINFNTSFTDAGHVSVIEDECIVHIVNESQNLRSCSDMYFSYAVKSLESDRTILVVNSDLPFESIEDLEDGKYAVQRCMNFEETGRSSCTLWHPFAVTMCPVQPVHVTEEHANNKNLSIDIEFSVMIRDQVDSVEIVRTGFDSKGQVIRKKVLYCEKDVYQDPLQPVVFATNQVVTEPGTYHYMCIVYQKDDTQTRSNLATCRIPGDRISLDRVDDRSIEVLTDKPWVLMTWNGFDIIKSKTNKSNVIDLTEIPTGMYTIKDFDGDMVSIWNP